MNRIPVNRIVSAFQNVIDYEKVEEFTLIMQEQMLSHNFPPIMGFESVVDENDIDNPDFYFMTGEKVEERHLNEKIWKVTKGHHRSLAGIAAELPYLECELDYSTVC